MDVNQATDGNLTGTGYYIPATQYTWVIDSGLVTGNHVVFDLHYTGGHETTWTTHVDANVQSNGSLLGTWFDNQGNSGPVTSYSGLAIATYTGSTGWPGLFSSNVQPFTFTTNRNGVGNWHLNLGKGDFPGPGTYALSIWINGGATILVSDNFTLNFPTTIGRCWDGMKGKFDKYGNDGDHDSRDFRDFNWKMPFRFFK
jgi:hypothetical protein